MVAVVVVVVVVGVVVMLIKMVWPSLGEGMPRHCYVMNY